MESPALLVETTVSLAPTQLSVSLATLVSTSIAQQMLVSVVLLSILPAFSALFLTVSSVHQEQLGMGRNVNHVHRHQLAANSVKVLPASSVSLITISMVLPVNPVNLLVYLAPQILPVSHAVSVSTMIQEAASNVLVPHVHHLQPALLAHLGSISTLELVFPVLRSTQIVCFAQIL